MNTICPRLDGSLGDAIGLVGLAPFLLVHVFPHRSQLAQADALPDPDNQNTFPGQHLLLAHWQNPVARFYDISRPAGSCSESSDGRYDHFYLCFIPIIWIAMRQGVRRVVTGLLALNFGIVIAMHLFPPTAVLFTKVACSCWWFRR